MGPGEGEDEAGWARVTPESATEPSENTATGAPGGLSQVKGPTPDFGSGHLLRVVRWSSTLGVECT